MKIKIFHGKPKNYIDFSYFAHQLAWHHNVVLESFERVKPEFRRTKSGRIFLSKPATVKSSTFKLTGNRLTDYKLDSIIE